MGGIEPKLPAHLCGCPHFGEFCLGPDCQFADQHAPICFACRRYMALNTDRTHWGCFDCDHVLPVVPESGPVSGEGDSAPSGVPATGSDPVDLAASPDPEPVRIFTPSASHVMGTPEGRLTSLSHREEIMRRVDAARDPEPEYDHEGCIGPDCPICLNPSRFPDAWKRRQPEPQETPAEQLKRVSGAIGRALREEVRRGPELPCGHASKSVVSSDEGTAYCAECEKEARDNAENLAKCKHGLPANHYCGMCNTEPKFPSKMCWCDTCDGARKAGLPDEPCEYCGEPMQGYCGTNRYCLHCAHVDVAIPRHNDDAAPLSQYPDTIACSYCGAIGEPMVCNDEDACMERFRERRQAKLQECPKHHGCLPEPCGDCPDHEAGPQDLPEREESSQPPTIDPESSRAGRKVADRLHDRTDSPASITQQHPNPSDHTDQLRRDLDRALIWLSDVGTTTATLDLSERLWVERRLKALLNEHTNPDYRAHEIPTGTDPGGTSQDPNDIYQVVKTNQSNGIECECKGIGKIPPDAPVGTGQDCPRGCNTETTTDSSSESPIPLKGVRERLIYSMGFSHGQKDAARDIIAEMQTKLHKAVRQRGEAWGRIETFERRLMVEWWGKRCTVFEPSCGICEAWGQYDKAIGR